MMKGHYVSVISICTVFICIFFSILLRICMYIKQVTEVNQSLTKDEC